MFCSAQQRKKKSEVPFFQSVPFLVGALLVIAVIIGFALMPPSTEKLFGKGEALMASERVSDWRKARGFFEQVIERNDDPQLVARAEELYQESRRRTLVQQAEQGFFLLSQSKNAKSFGEAVSLAQEGRQEEAIVILQQLIESIDPDGDERYIRVEAIARLDQITAAEPDLPTDTEQLIKLIEATNNSSLESELLADQRLLSRIVLKFAGEEGYIEVVAAAKQGIKSNEERLELVRKMNASPSDEQDKEPSEAN